MADHSLKPIITHVEATGRTIAARAVCFDSTHHYLYYSDLATGGSISRISLADDGTGSVDSTRAKIEFDPFLPNVGTVYGMTIDAGEGENGGHLYFSETHSGTISRVELSADGAPLGTPQVLASGLTDPTAVALEPNGPRLFFTLRGGSIRAVTRDRSVSTDILQTASSEDGGGGYEVRRFDSGTRLEGIAIAEAEGAGTDPRELRLYWAESGRASAIKRSSLDGTRPEEVLVLNGDAETSLVWPRGLTFGAGASAGLLFCEQLGSVRLLPDAAGGLAETIVRADSYPAAVAVQAMVAAADRNGAAGALFTQSVG